MQLPVPCSFDISSVWMMFHVFCEHLFVGTGGCFACCVQNCHAIHHSMLACIKTKLCGTLNCINELKYLARLSAMLLHYPADPQLAQGYITACHCDVDIQLLLALS